MGSKNPMMISFLLNVLNSYSIGGRLPRTTLVTHDRTNKTRKTKKSIRAISRDIPSTPDIPNAPATIAKTRKVIISCIIKNSLKKTLLFVVKRNKKKINFDRAVQIFS